MLESEGITYRGNSTNDVVPAAPIRKKGAQPSHCFSYLSVPNSAAEKHSVGIFPGFQSTPTKQRFCIYLSVQFFAPEPVEFWSRNCVGDASHNKFHRTARQENLQYLLCGSLPAHPRGSFRPASGARRRFGREWKIGAVPPVRVQPGSGRKLCIPYRARSESTSRGHRAPLARPPCGAGN